MKEIIIKTSDIQLNIEDDLKGLIANLETDTTLDDKCHLIAIKTGKGVADVREMIATHLFYTDEDYVFKG